MMGHNNEITVQIDKTKLLAALKEARKQHKETYEKALELWREDLEKACKEVKADNLTDFPRSLHRISNSVPSSYDDDYRKIIRLYEMESRDEVTLTQSQFNQYVLDEWGWKRVAMSNAYYSSASTGVRRG